jgi:hypothetical protein
VGHTDLLYQITEDEAGPVDQLTRWQIRSGELAEPVPAETGVMARVHHRDRQGHQALHGHAVLVDAGVAQLVQ